jgi:hypothetical protein
MEGIEIKEDKKKITATFTVTAVIVKNKGFKDFYNSDGWKKLAEEKLRQLVADKVMESAIKEITNIVGLYGYFINPHVTRSIILMNPNQLSEILRKVG